LDTLESRLRILEHKILSEKLQTNLSALDNNPKSLLVQVESVADRLRDQFNQRLPLKEFHEKYEKFEAILTLDDYLFERNHLPPEAKAEMLILAEPDMTAALEQLKEVRDLEKHVNSKELQDVEKIIPSLHEVEAKHDSQVAHVEELSRRLTALLASYNDTVHTLSEVFINWHHSLRAFEARVESLERTRNK